MRLMAQQKLGYYPIPTRALAMLTRILQPVDSADAARFTMIDPCCGKGAALRQLGEALGIPPENRYGIELDEYRSNAARDNNPGSPILGPCAFETAAVHGADFSLVYLNPPFDDEMGGGARAEYSFLRRVHPIIVKAGVLVMVLPHRTWHTRKELRVEVDSCYQDVRTYAFPASCRKYGEVFVVGIRRTKMVAVDKDSPCSGDNNWSPYAEKRYPAIDSVAAGPLYALPHGTHPRRFLKMGYTEAELVEAIEASPLNRLLEPPTPPPKRRPPLPPNRGQLGLLLASGELQGVVSGPGITPHVIRGSVRKEKYERESETTVSESGAATTKTVMADKVVRTVRIVMADGRIKTLEG